MDELPVGSFHFAPLGSGCVHRHGKRNVGDDEFGFDDHAIGGLGSGGDVLSLHKKTSFLGLIRPQ